MPSMSSVLTITEEIKTLAQLERHLGIRLSDDADFFQEWSGELEPIAETSQARTNLYAVLQILKTLGRFPFREAFCFSRGFANANDLRRLPK
jgi:hypothetical protein